MKKQKIIALIGAGILAPLFLGASTYAADPEITINNGAENLYVATGTKTSTDGKASYDAATNTLTLDNFNGDDIKISNLESATIALRGNNTISMATENTTGVPQGITAYDVDLTITGTGSLKVSQTTMSSLTSSASIIYANSITIDSATIDFEAPVRTCLSSNNSWVASNAHGNITINSGKIRLACNTAVLSENITINGGDIYVEKELSSEVVTSKNLTINDGTLTINAPTHRLGSAATFYGNIEINGGTTVINGGQYGIDFTDLSGTLSQVGHFKITGGVLDIKNVDYGIHLGDANENSYIEFSGGTTILDAKYSSAEIIFNTESDRNIIIADDMNLYPKNLDIKMDYTNYSNIWEEYVYSLASNDKIANYSIISDEEINAPEEEPLPVPDTGTDTKAPDTGFFTGEIDGTKAIIYVGAAILGAGVLYLITYSTKRGLHRNRFRK